ncbi:aldose 1-epimerase [Ensifer sp. MJa1]|uniref:aldose 1-epimerase n=1 Tax=Ensifer sp. MJa1 TaxID=2919888 RepID=UPI00300843DD
MSGDRLLLQHEGLAVEVSPLGGAILLARWHGIPVLSPTQTPGLASQLLGTEACFPLVPFGNRIEDSAFQFEGRDYALAPNTADPLVLHGDGWLRRWSILRQDRQSVTLDLRQEASAATPFAYEAVQTIAISGDSLSLSLAVTNRAPQPLPYGLGFHPYFPRTPGMRVYARAAQYWTEREKHLPGAPGPMPHDLDFARGGALAAGWLNNAFDGWDGKMRVEWPEADLAISLDADENFNCFVLYSPSTDAGFFCFEPMTHLPNAYHLAPGNGLVRLAPGETFEAKVTLRCRYLDTISKECR